MSLIDSALSFIEGIKSAMEVSGAIRGTISDAITEGIENAFRKIMLPLERTLMRASFAFVSVLFIVWGFALFVDNFVPYNGMGFVIVGAIFGIGTLVFLKEKEK